uniref:Serpentine receptor class gamma n=1 Tax=Caenorhabditis japonica TaxID=281687 RepID=A0A8R1EHP6_CAEJA
MLLCKILITMPNYAFQNIICWLNSWPGLRLESHPIGVVIMKQVELLLPGLLTMTKFLTNFFLHMQFCSAISMNIHRISSAIYPMKYEWVREV